MRQLSYQIEGLEADNGDVRLTVFVEKMAALRRLIREAAIEVRGEDTRKLIVKDLRHRSPATVVVAGPEKIVEPIVISIATAFDQVRSDTFKPFTRFAFVEAADELIRGIGTAYQSARLTFDMDAPFGRVDITSMLADKITRLKLPVVESKGSAKGRIEIVNIHSDQPRFYVYRPAGFPRRVTCLFPEKLLPKAKEALGRTATVRGKAKFEKDSLLPTEIDVSEIEIHDPDEELPTLSGLIGAAPEATGDKGTLEFIEEIRRARNA